MTKPPTARLNPFALPTETNALFILLLSAAVAVLFNTGFTIGTWYDNLQSAGTSYPRIETPADLENLSYVKEVIKGNIEAEKSLLLSSFYQLSLLLLLPAIATCLYLIYPSLLRKRRGLQKLKRDRDPKMFDEIGKLIGLAKPARPIGIEIEATSDSTGAQAFGLPGRYSICFGKGSRLLLRQRRLHFKAIALHEIAHIANGDVPLTYYAISIWIALIAEIMFISALYLFFNFTPLSTTVPTITNLIDVFPPQTIYLFIVQFWTTVIIISSILASFLRTRELYADSRAAQWGAQTALSELIQRNQADVRVRLLHGWRLHPALHERLFSLENPEVLFKAKGHIAFFVGVLLPYTLLGGAFFIASQLIWFGLPMTNIVIVGVGFIPISETVRSIIADVAVIAMAAFALLIIVVCFLSVAYMISGTLGVQIQREAIADLALKNRASGYQKLWKHAVLVSMGFVLGLFTMPVNGYQWIADILNGNISYSPFVTLTVFLALFTICATWLWLVYARFFSRRIFGSYIGTVPPKIGWHPLTLALSFVLLFLYTPVVHGYVVILHVGHDSGYYDPGRPLSSLVFSCLFALIGYIFLFCITWLLLKFRQFFRKSACPHCGFKTRARNMMIGQTCEKCGKELGTWLYMSKIIDLE
ncbi:MAG: M48 family metalloprotease [Anaerolineales bacterium]|nr:M48 family metalloprotease [Anaerolineales bacterium]